MDGQLLSEFRKLIDFCAAYASFNPPNVMLQIAQLEAKYAAGLAAVSAVSTQIAPFKVAANEHQRIWRSRFKRTAH